MRPMMKALCSLSRMLSLLSATRPKGARSMLQHSECRRERFRDLRERYDKLDSDLELSIVSFMDKNAEGGQRLSIPFNGLLLNSI